MAISQQPTNTPISVVRGDDLTFTVRVPLDLTGHTWSAGVFLATNPTAAVEFAPTTSATPVPTPSEGDPYTDVTVTVTGVQTGGLSPRKAWAWFLRSTSPTSKIRTHHAGEFRVLGAVPAS